MLKRTVKNFIEQRPHLWRLVWETAQSSNIFLPHDPTYKALPYLIRDTQSIILDIGANQGISALSFRKLCPSNPIISFEPNFALEADLQRVERRIDNFEFHMCGLGDVEGEFELFVPKYKNVYLHTFSSLDRNSLEKAIMETYSSAVSRFIEITSFICKIRTLDSFGYSPNVLKVDAEGFEEKIFAGGEATLHRHRPSIIFEAVHGALGKILEKLRSLEYKIVSFIPSQDAFQPFQEKSGVPYVSGSRNLIAVSGDVLATLKLV